MIEKIATPRVKERPIALKEASLWQQIKFLQSRNGPVFLLLPVLFLLALFLLPLFYVILRGREVGLTHALELIFRPRIYELLFNTLKIDLTVTATAIFLGVSAAWFIERTNLPGRKAWHVLVTLPFAVPAFVSGYSWISVFPKLQGFWGAYIVLSFSYYPLVYLPVVAAMRGIDPALEETARSLGYSRSQVFFKVTLPLLKPAVLAGALLVALHILAEFGALAFVNYDTFTVAIYDQYEVAFNSAAAAMMTFVLLFFCLLVLVLEFWVRGNRNYASHHKGASGTLERISLGKSTVFIFIGFVVLIVFAIGVPFGSLIYWMIRGSSTMVEVGKIGETFLTTLLYGLSGSFLAICLALPLVVLAIRYKGIFSVLADRMPYFIHSLPGIVIGLTFVFFAVRYAYPLYQTVILLLVAYAMLYLPLAQSSIHGVMVQVPRQMEEVGLSLGKSSVVVFFKVTLPLIFSGVAAGFALVSLKVMSELTATLILRPTGVDTLATMVWEHTQNARYGASAPYALLLILISGVPVYLLMMRSFNAKEK